MKLHEEKFLFNKMISATRTYTKFDEDKIIKDYYSMLILQRISKEIPEMIFKGGTSLSKGHKVIDRFSEDIDLTCMVKPTESNRRQISHTIQKIVEELGLELINKDNIKSKSDHNVYKVDYPHTLMEDSELRDYIQIETAYFMDCFPYEEKEIKSYVLEYLESLDNKKIIEDYDLHSFKIKVQSLERTFADKVFALCDYALRNKVNTRARHIYDLYKIFPLVKDKDNLKELIKKVRMIRSKHEKCESAKDGVNINEILQRIIDENIFKNDFERTTKSMFTINENITYKEALSIINEIIESNLFE